MKKKKNKLVPLNVTIPHYLREYAEKIASSKYDSISDYIRTLIKEDKRRDNGDNFDKLLDSLSQAIREIPINHESIINSKEGIELINQRLATIAELFQTGLGLREIKLKRDNPKISEKELIKKLNAWSLSSPAGEEVPGLFEISEKRKKRLLNG